MTGKNIQPQQRHTNRRRIALLKSAGAQYFMRHPLFSYSAFVGVSLLLLGSVAVASLPA